MSAQGGYPNKPVRMVVGFPPGQATDIVARAVAQKLTESLGQSVFVDNRPGAAGIIGTEVAIKAGGDGYTLLMSSSGPLAVNPGLYAKLPYDPLRDLAPITLVASVPLFLVAHPSLPANNVPELIALAKQRPGEINYASGGSGVTNHLVMEMFKSAAGVNLVHVPYKGGPPALTDLIAGQVSVMFETGPGALPHVRSGKLKALATGGARRSVAMPELATVAEQGIAGFDGVAWIGFVAPAGTPRAIVDRLNEETVKILALPDVRERFVSQGAEPVGNSPGEFAAYIKAEIAKWGKVIRESGAKVD
ncbi:MAG TPA: tripartite tricarboxylate transporter substrate binding protein [Burkholderiales bacterium]|nr:tripartite tricarboxylate transporter substrate binding protein [Burkholderiales bacterium]